MSVFFCGGDVGGLEVKTYVGICVLVCVCVSIHVCINICLVLSVFTPENLPSCYDHCHRMSVFGLHYLRYQREALIFRIEIMSGRYSHVCMFMYTQTHVRACIDKQNYMCMCIYNAVHTHMYTSIQNI